MDVVVVSWPSGPLVVAARDRAVDTARSAGHRVTDLDLVALGFEARMPPEEHTAYQAQSQEWGEALASHVAAVEHATALVFVYPTVATSLPPVLKGWMERVMVPGIAFVLDDRSHRVRPGLTHVRRILGIATYEEPWALVKLRSDNGRRIVLRALRLNTGLRARGRWVGCYRAGSAGDEARSAFLDRVERAVGRL